MRASRLFITASMVAFLATSQVGSADTAHAQTRVAVSTQVHSWGPQTGEIGTLVTITGSGFTRRLQIVVDGRVVRPTKMTSTSIAFRVPQSGNIVLRKAGNADIHIGTYNGWATPQLRNFSPTFGGPGTRVSLTGVHIAQGDRVMLGNQPVPVESWNPSGCVVVIPPNATTGFFSVTNSHNAVAKSRKQFRVTVPAPYIDSFTPTSGPPGTVIRINGGHYREDIRASYGRHSMPIIAKGPGWFEVAIPQNAKRSAMISIFSPRGRVKSKALFSLSLPPVLSSYSPTWGSVGTQVRLNGRHFQPGDRITLAGSNCNILQLDDRSITVEIPHGARGGAFALHRGQMQVQTSTRFEVMYAPTISNVTPWRGAPGTRVSISGNNLTGAQVMLGGRPVRAVSSTDTQIQFDIPRWAQSGKLSVVNRNRQSVSYTRDLEVWNFPGIRKISPMQGGPGTQVTLFGTMLNNTQHVYLNEMEMRIVSRGRDRIVVEVPQSAQSGIIRWGAYGQTRPTRWNFNVLRAPVIASYSPMTGAPGSIVTINGEGFDRATRVFYGSSPIKIIRLQPNQLSVQIPRNTYKSEHFILQSRGGRIQSPQRFSLQAPPTLVGFSPNRIKPGGTITLNGNNLTADSIVIIGNQRAQVLGVPRDRGIISSLAVVVPQLASGRYRITVESRGLKTTNRRSLIVDGWAQINAIPTQARPGQKIRLSGSNLFNVQVWLGNQVMPIVKTDRRGRKIWVQVPTDATGAQQITVDDNGHKSTSAQSLNIVGPPPPPRFKVRDNRGSRERKGRRGRRKVRDRR